MIPTTHTAADMYRRRVNPRVSLTEAAVAMQPCEAIAAYVRDKARAQYRTATAHVVTRFGRIAGAWPLSVVVSGGPL